jgi:polyisoprenoid-binding protein YceI
MKNMKKVFSFVVAAFISTSLFAQTTWKADNAHSSLGFSITHLGISDIPGTFNSFDATVESSKEDFSDAVIELSVDVESIDTEVEKRDDHLKSADFFDVAKFPKMTFKSTSVKKTGKDKYKVTGDLTLHGVTKPVTMDLWYRGTTENPMSKALTSGFQLTGTLKRSDFNFGSGFPAPMLSDEVNIEANGEFVKQ